MTKHLLYGCLAIGVLACGHNRYLQTSEVQLSPPLYTVDSILFIDQMTTQLTHPESGVSLHYSTHSTEVSKSDPIAPRPFIIQENAVVRIRAFHEEYAASDIVQFEARKINCPNALAGLEESSSPTTPYLGDGIKSLTDLRKGNEKFQGDNSWLGFQEREVLLHFNVQDMIQCSTLTVSTLSQNTSWIFSPVKIDVMSGSDIIGSVNIESPKAPESEGIRFWDIDLDTAPGERITVRIQNLSELPEWHPGAGAQPWLFVDEIFFN